MALGGYFWLDHFHSRPAFLHNWNSSDLISSLQNIFMLFLSWSISFYSLVVVFSSEKGSLMKRCKSHIIRFILWKKEGQHWIIYREEAPDSSVESLFVHKHYDEQLVRPRGRTPEPLMPKREKHTNTKALFQMRWCDLGVCTQDSQQCKCVHGWCDNLTFIQL